MASRLTALGAVTVAFLSAAAAAAPARSIYDGLWSVLVITDSGTCDRGYRYLVRVEDGRVYYSGEAGIDVSGRVSGNGHVNVVIGRGDQSASGTGRLYRDQGSGVWRGASSSNACSGHWEAERRAAAN